MTHEWTPERRTHKVRRRMTRTFAFVAAIVLLVPIVEVFGMTAGSAAPATRVAIATASGDAVRVTALGIPKPTLPPGTTNAQADLGWSSSSIDGDGIGLGTNVADGSAKPVSAVVNNVSTLVAGQSDSTAPPADSESHSIVNINNSGFNLTAVQSASSANAPFVDSTCPPAGSTVWSCNKVVTASASIPAPFPALNTSNIASNATAASVPNSSGNPNGQAAAASHVTLTGLNLGILTLNVTLGDAKASATATGIASGPGASSASASCTAISVTATLSGLPLKVAQPVCGGPAISVAGLVTLTPGKPVTSVSANSASASVTALTITSSLLGNVKIELGKADAAASLAPIAPPLVCGATPPPAGGVSGTAQGDVVNLTAAIGGQPLGQVDVARSDSAIDEAGVKGTSKGAVADGVMGRTQTFQGSAPTPSDATALPSHADAPPTPSSQSISVLNLPPTAGVSATVASTSANASTASNSALADPHASASTAAATANAASPLGLPISLNDATVTSSANSDKVGNGAASSATSNVQHLAANVAGINIAVDALQSNASASATGSPGGASTAADYTFASVTVGALPPIVIKPAPNTSITVLPGITLTFGRTNATTASDGSAAKVSMDALVVTVDVPAAGGGLAHVSLAIGHSEASANATNARPAAGVICKDVDIHYDPAGHGSNLTFGDDGKTVAPHQKFYYRVCIVSTGGSTLRGATFTDVLDPRLLVIELPDGVHQVGGSVADGQFYPSGGSLVSDPVDLAPGASICKIILVENNPDTTPGDVINNTATFTSDSGASGTSNTVHVISGFDTTRPALFATVSSLSLDPNTNVWTIDFVLHNDSRAGVAYNPAIESIITNTGQHLIDPPPSFSGTLAPGDSIPFTVHFDNPPGQTQIFGDIREVADDAAGHHYAFDSTPLPRS